MSAEALQKLANTKFEIQATKRGLLERLESQLTFAYDGGLFKVTPEFLALLYIYENEQYETIVMLDEYQNPIKVNVLEIKEQALEAHQCALNAYLNSYNHLKKVRKGDKL